MIEAAAAIGLPLLTAARARSARRVEPGARRARASRAPRRLPPRSSSGSAEAPPWTAAQGFATSSESCPFRRPSSATCTRRSRTPRVSSARRRVRRPRPCRSRASTCRRWTSSRRTPASPAPGRPEGLGRGTRGARRRARGRCAGGTRPRRLRRAPRRVRPRGDGRGSGRPHDRGGKGARSRRRALRCRRRALRRVRWSRRPGRRSCRDGQPVRSTARTPKTTSNGSGGAWLSSALRRLRDGRPSPRASSRRPAVAPRRTA